MFENYGEGYVITRPINGITINGDEFVLNDCGDVMVFASKRKAKLFLQSNGIRHADYDKLGITIRHYTDSEIEISTNIGVMPIVDYREIIAGQSGYDSYDSFYRAGCRLGNGYDKGTEA